MRILGVTEKLRKAAISLAMSVSVSVSPSVRPHETTRLLLDGFLWNLLFEGFSKICGCNASFIVIRQEYRVLYTKTYVQFLYCLAELFLE